MARCFRYVVAPFRGSRVDCALCRLSLKVVFVVVGLLGLCRLRRSRARGSLVRLAFVGIGEHPSWSASLFAPVPLAGGTCLLFVQHLVPPSTLSAAFPHWGSAVDGTGPAPRAGARGRYRGCVGSQPGGLPFGSVPLVWCGGCGCVLCWRCAACWLLPAWRPCSWRSRWFAGVAGWLLCPPGAGRIVLTRSLRRQRRVTQAFVHLGEGSGSEGGRRRALHDIHLQEDEDFCRGVGLRKP